jgi:hypothetical protein
MKEILRLKRFLDMAPVRPPAERCEFCGAPILEQHSHVIDKENRRLVCSCRPCYLLFTNPAAAGGRYRSVSDRYERVPESELDLNGFEMPIGMAFFLRSSQSNRVTAFYPSPGGALESGLDVEENAPVWQRLEPDIEALLVYRHKGGAEAWVLPVDECYQLVGRIRRCWRGFDGGAEAHAEIAAFFSKLQEQGSLSCSL